MGISGKVPTAYPASSSWVVTADQSCELNIQNIFTVFPLPINHIKSFSKKPPQASVRTFLQNLFQNLPFPSTFSNAILQNVLKDMLLNSYKREREKEIGITDHTFRQPFFDKVLIVSLTWWRFYIRSLSDYNSSMSEPNFIAKHPIVLSKVKGWPKTKG